MSFATATAANDLSAATDSAPEGKLAEALEESNVEVLIA